MQITSTILVSFGLLLGSCLGCSSKAELSKKTTSSLSETTDSPNQADEIKQLEPEHPSVGGLPPVNEAVVSGSATPIHDSEQIPVLAPPVTDGLVSGGVTSTTSASQGMSVGDLIDLAEMSPHETVDAARAFDLARLADEIKLKEADLKVELLVRVAKFETEDPFKGWLILTTGSRFGADGALEIGFPPAILQKVVDSGVKAPESGLLDKTLQVVGRVACIDEPSPDGNGTYRQVRLAVLDLVIPRVLSTK